MMSQSSKNSPALEVSDPMDRVEHLDIAPNPPTAPSPIAGSSTVAYGPDQMLAVYAARGKANTTTTSNPQPSPTHLAPIAQPKPVATRQNSGMRLLGNLGKRDEATSPSPVPVSAPAPGDMKSFVHLNNGVVSSSVVDAYEPALAVPGAGAGKSRLSEGSAYSEEEVGEAK
jgi:hypothetical protein